MKNKKAQGLSTNAIVLIILGIIFLVVLIIGFSFGWEKIAPWLPQDEFNIIKDECRNETKIEITCVWDTTKNINESIKECYEEHINDNFIEKEICEQVEVDYLKIGKAVYTSDFLTIEWLDENCCTLLTPEKYRTNMTEKQKDVVKDLTEGIKEGNKKYIYECGDYFVEVLK